jgi:hypothetical protein
MAQLVQAVANLLFGCQHRRTTFPLTPKRRSGATAASRFGTYVACLDCGEELAYDWQEMRVGPPVTSHQSSAEAQPSFR